MAYRNGTYIAFHAEGKTDPTASDIKYYRMMKAWHEHDDVEFKFVNSHDKVAAVRDTSTKQTIMRSLRERLNNSKNMVLIVGNTTKNDTDFVPYEIAYAVDTCKIPIICVYTAYASILNPKSHRSEWPSALAERIDAKTVRAFSYEQASYTIQDTPEMVAKHYGRFLPQDKAAMAAKILNRVWEAAA